jgi:hypothetical protein
MSARNLIVAIALASAASSCSDSHAVTAKQIQSRVDLIGGPGALGDVGDYLLANDQIRVIVQGDGYSRGFGIYGGSLIDADLQRPVSVGDSSGGKGYDNFSELFPALFLKAMKPTRIETKQNDDGSASIEVSGSAADFVFLAKRINDVLVNSEKLLFKNVYRLEPKKRYVEITTTVTNGGDLAVSFPDPGVTSLIGDSEFVYPVGDVILFGAGNDVFAETSGFDTRFTLERLYTQPAALPKLPGLITPFVATKGDKISYGFMSGITDPATSLMARAGYDAPVDDLLIPFIASAFTGAFYGAAPTTLERGQSFSFKKYFIVGGGDIASVRDVVHQIRGIEGGTFGGRVREHATGAPEAGASVLTFDESGGPYSQHNTDENGQFFGAYAPGKYSYRVLADGRYPTAAVPFEITAGNKTGVEIELPSAGTIAVRIVGEDGQLLPVKCNIVGTYQANATGFPAWEFLYELELGEHARWVDLIPDGPAPDSRRFIEKSLLAPNGMTSAKIRPGNYRAFCSHGPEYDVWEQDVVVQELQVAQVDGFLRHVVDTAGWASGDFHLHANNSVDSSMINEDRVAHCAAEGLDLAVATDHNFITDYTQAIASQKLERWVQGMVGLEMTTIEVGHFNGFPLKFEPGPITKGAFAWSGRTPQELFDDLRAHGAYSPEQTIVQVNHPRDSILGYFNGYNWNPDTGEAEDPSSLLLAPEGPEFGPDKFSYDFDAIEIYNAKRYELLRHYRVPEVLPPPPLPEVIPPVGTILRDENGKVAFPGGLDDWFTLLDRGNVYTAMGNSDTHALEDEPGTPRTYFPVSDDRPGLIDELEVVKAIKAQQTLPTNGPFVKIGAKGDGRCFSRKTNEPLGKDVCGMGEVVVPADGKITLDLDIQTAPWVKIDKVTLTMNGEVIATIEGNRETLGRISQSVPVREDGWLIAEISGEASMFPMVTTREVPSIQISNALGSIASAFGFSLSPFGNLRPSEVTIAKPYAFTNPIFIDATGDGWTPRGLGTRALTAAEAPRCSASKADYSGLPAIAKIFAMFNCGHGHH